MRKLIVELDEELHKKMRIRVAEVDSTIKQYITDLIEKDVQKEKE